MEIALGIVGASLCVPHFANAHFSVPFGHFGTPSAVLHTLARKFLIN